MKNPILNVDTGVDDAMGIILLAKYGIKPEFIVSASGNTDVENTYRNTLGVVSLLNIDVPVYRGSSRPLIKPHYVEDFHGENGIAGYKFSTVIKENKINGIVKMYESLKDHKNTIISTSPLTSIAILLSLDPDIAKRIDEIIIMGGAFRFNSYGKGNMGNSEFNIFYDPDAAAIVFKSGIKITAIPLDLTMDPEFSVTKNDLEKINIDYPAGSFMKAVLSDMISRHGKLEMHDPIAVFSYINEKAFKYKYGQITCDLDGVTSLNEEKNCSSRVAISLDERIFNNDLKKKLLFEK